MDTEKTKCKIVKYKKKKPHGVMLSLIKLVKLSSAKRQILTSTDTSSRQHKIINKYKL